MNANIWYDIFYCSYLKYATAVVCYISIKTALSMFSGMTVLASKLTSVTEKVTSSLKRYYDFVQAGTLNPALRRLSAC